MDVERAYFPSCSSHLKGWRSLAEATQVFPSWERKEAKHSNGTRSGGKSFTRQPSASVPPDLAWHSEHPPLPAQPLIALGHCSLSLLGVNAGTHLWEQTQDQKWRKNCEKIPSAPQMGGTHLLTCTTKSHCLHASASGPHTPLNRTLKGQKYNRIQVPLFQPQVVVSPFSPTGQLQYDLFPKPIVKSNHCFL